MSSTNNEEGSAAAGSTVSRIAAISSSLDTLDDNYQEMKETQAVLLQALEKLQKEEASLSKAITISQEQAKAPQRPKKKDDNAIKRLQDALLNVNDSDDESSIWN